MPPQRHLPLSTQPRVRQRIQRACAPCRKRKIKCDGVQPVCAACAGYGYECVYTEPPPRKAASSMAASSPTRAQSDTLGPECEPEPAQKELKEADAPFLSSESTVQGLIGHTFLHQSLKTRFTSAHSSIAWPKTLGLTLGMQVPPRLQSFAWNPGTRPESNALPQTSIRDIISLEEMKNFASVYFTSVHPFFGILNQEMFEKRSVDIWFSQRPGTDFEACVCGVVALGSYFSGSPSPSEAQVAEQAKLLLDLTISHAPALLSVKHVVAWVLRALYLRCTTRPHLSWMASNNALHIAEALGLHREFSEIHNGCTMLRKVSPLEIDLRRRTFWVAVALNQFFASEYGRTRIHIDFVGSKPLAPLSGDFTAETVAILQSVPRTQFLPGNGSDLVDVLRKAAALPIKAPFLGLLRADACFCAFRILSSANVHLPATEIGSLLDVIRVALDAVKFLRTMRQAWWNIVFTPFHSVCVLLTIGTSESLAMIPQAMEVLKGTVDVYTSHLSTEALRTAHSLVQGTREKRMKELESLDESLSVVGEMSQPLLSNGDINFGSNNFEWSMNNEFGVSDFLDLGTYYEGGLEVGS